LEFRRVLFRSKSAAPIAPIPALVATKRLASPASSEVWQFRCPRKNPRRSPNQIRKRPAVFHPQVVRRAFRGPSRRIESASFRRRSEEHTSELQSRFDLVCRLLLEKKKYR